MDVKTDTPGDVLRALEGPRAELAKYASPEWRSKDRAEKLNDYEPGQRYAYAPSTEKTKVAQQIDEEHEERAGQMVFHVEHTAKALEAPVTAWETEGREPLDPVSAWQCERRQSGTLPPIEVLQLSMLSEQHYARFDREYGEALPRKVLEAYQTALTRPFRQDAASLIRWVEARHAGRWTGRGIDGNADEAHAVLALDKAIKEARNARIPEDVKAARKAITDAYAETERAKADGVRSRRPRAL